MRALTPIVFTTMVLGFIAIVSIACQEESPGFPQNKQDELNLVIQRLKDRGLYDMDPKVRANSKIHLKYALDSMEFCD